MAGYLLSAKVSSADFVKRAGDIKESLVSGGVVEVVVGKDSGAAASVRDAMVLGGFVNVADGEGGVITAATPSFAKAVPFKRKSKKQKKGNVWQIMADDADGDYDMEDEDALLEGTEDVLVEAAKDREDCATAVKAGKRRACKNCTCGLRDMQGNEVATTPDEGDDEIVPAAAPSGCGSCAKGDAFRCATCPYLGTPAFEEGTKPAIITTADGGVKLDI